MANEPQHGDVPPSGSSGHQLPASPPRIDPTALLARLWTQNLPLMRERVAFLEKAAETSLKGALRPEDRTEAGSIAHKLAGSLGMFGYPRGTDLARELEQLLEAPGTPDADRFAALAAELRSVLPL